MSCHGPIVITTFAYVIFNASWCTAITVCAANLMMPPKSRKGQSTDER